MIELIKGTTPTIQFVFSAINVAEIETAFLIVKQFNRNVIEKSIDEADIDTESNSLEWELEQQDSLKLSARDEAVICCDWKLQDGTRGRSNVVECRVTLSGKDEVI